MNPYQEFLSCQKDFIYFCENYIKITHPVRGLVPFKLHDYQKHFLKVCNENRFVVGIKFRQGGFTTLTVLDAMWKCMFQQDKRVYVAAKTEREAVHLAKIVENALNNFPHWFCPKMDKNTQTEKVFTATGSRLTFGIMDGLRGRAVDHLVIDEPAFIPNMEEKWRVCWPAVQGSVIAISTTNGLGNWFDEVYHAAQAGKNKFCAYHGNYKDHPEYADEAWCMEMRKRLGEKGWLQEVEGCFVGEEPEYLSVANFRGVKDDELINKAMIMINTSRMPFENRSLVYELVFRLALKNSNPLLPP